MHIADARTQASPKITRKTCLLEGPNDIWSNDLLVLFRLPYGVSHERKLDVLCGQHRFFHGGLGETRHPAPKTEDAKAFIQQLVDDFGQKIPDSEFTELPPNTKDNHFIAYCFEQT